MKPEFKAVKQLGHLAVKDYLLAKGWERAPGRRPDVGIFRRPGSEEAEVLLPLRSDFPDVIEAMIRVVEEIGRFEQRPAEQILRDLLRPRADVVRFGVESRETVDGGIGLDDGLALLAGSKKALLASACSVRRPQRFHPRMSLREADAFVRACRLGQTEQGSFIVSVACAFDVEGTEKPFITEPLFKHEEREPFGRKVTVLLMRSVARIVDAIRADTLQTLTDPAPEDPVVSANLCEAIVEMMPRPEDTALRMTPSWSPLLTAPRDIPTVVRVERQYCPVIEEVAQALRTRC